jgi:hypothetical protein
MLLKTATLTCILILSSYHFLCLPDGRISNFSPQFLINSYSGGGGGFQLGSCGTAAINRPIVPAPDDYDDGGIGGMIGRRN